MVNINLTGRTVLITGGTRGIGLGILKVMMESNANVIFTGTKSLNKYSDLDESIKDNAKYIQTDLCTENGLNNLISSLRKENSIDICINNAGTNKIINIENFELRDYNYISNINLISPMVITKIVVEKMKEKKWGRVINIGSLWSTITRAGRSLYTVSKHGLLGFTKTSALEYAKWNILVNMVSPGFVNTELSFRTLKNREREEISSKIPVGRFAEMNDIANVVLFLSSDLNNYITGQNIIVDGGYICE